MAETEANAVETAPQTNTGRIAGEPSGTYRMSREGRRQAIILLLGVISIWIFALWSLITIFADGIHDVEWVTGLLMLAILLVAPLVAWTLLEEASSRVWVDDRGITYATVGGIRLTAPWADVTGFKAREGRGRIARFFLGDTADKTTTVDDAASVREAAGDDSNTTGEEDPETTLLATRGDPSIQISNPLVRFLHRQSYGAGAIPIHGGLENQGALRDEISSRLH